MSDGLLDLRSAKRAVRDGLAPHLEPLGMAPGADRDGWQRVLSRGMSVVAVWFQYARPSRAQGLVLSEPLSKAVSVRGEVGVGPNGGDAWSWAQRLGTEPLPRHMPDAVREQMRLRAWGVVEPWIDAQPPTDDEHGYGSDEEFVQKRLGWDDMFYPLPDRDEVAYWCSVAGPAIAEIVGTILRRDAWQPD